MADRQSMNRRGFLKGAATAGAAAVAFPMVIPGASLGKDGAVAPSNRIVMGSIGVGSMGSGDQRAFLGKQGVQFVGVCDVDKRHRDAAKGRVDQKNGNTDCAAYVDFRELIGRGDLDAVHCALPDQWHAMPVIAAARAGLDIFGQKPFARSIREGRAMVNAIKRYGCIWETGSQQRSDHKFRYACEIVRNGVIGRVDYAEVGLPKGRPTSHMAVSKTPPPEIDWNRWLGPAPWREYCDFGRRGGPHWDWRWILDFSGGQLTDWAGHHIDICQWGLGLERSGPVECEGRGWYPEDGGLYDTPYDYLFTNTYANGVRITVGNDNHPVPNGPHGLGKDHKIRRGATWFGENGRWVGVNRRGLYASHPDILRSQFGANDIHLYPSGNHHQCFINCVRSRKETIAPPEIGHRSISAALVGEIAMLTGRKIRFDPVNEEILDDPAAAALLGKSYREPWTL